MFSLLFMIVRFVRGLMQGFRDPEFKGLFYFVVSLLVVGAAFYHYVEGWRVLDSLYFSIATLTTIGYGDFAPKTDLGKIFTMIYIFVGVGTILGFLNLVSHHSGENDPIHKLIAGRRRNIEGVEEV